MKVASYQLEQHLAKNLAPIYLISGDEILLAQDAVHSILTKAKSMGYSERISITLEPGMDWGKLFFAETQSLSLFATQRIIELHLAGAKPNAAAAKILQEITSTPLTDTLLIITTNKLDKKVEQSAWYKAIDKKGVTMAIWPIPQEQLPGWIQQRAKKSNLQITGDAAKILAQQVEGNLLAATQEIEKLGLLQINKVIDANVVTNTVTDNARFDIYSLVDAALSGDAKRSLRMLINLQEEDAEPILILWALSREIRVLHDLAQQLKQGISLGTLFSKYRIWEKRQPAVRHFLQRQNSANCRKLLRDCALIDKMIKGAAIGNKWLALQQLALKIAGNAILELNS